MKMNIMEELTKKCELSKRHQDFNTYYLLQDVIRMINKKDKLIEELKKELFKEKIKNYEGILNNEEKKIKKMG